MYSILVLLTYSRKALWHDMLQRRILPQIAEDLKEKMVLLSGPRQAGKTTVAEKLLQINGGVYYNWDVSKHRLKIQKGELSLAEPFWVFDELHKFKRWKNWLKGTYDLYHHEHQILVTGSARLDLFSKGGDSLQGRFYAHRLHPVSLSEYLSLKNVDYIEAIQAPDPIHFVSARTALEELLNLSGFPEPLLSGSKMKANRWRLSYGSRLVYQDIRDTSNIREIERLELFYDRLAEVAGGIFSAKKIAEELEIAADTAKSWCRLFERFYACFLVPPLGLARYRTLKKDRKLYLWDWARPSLPGSKVENLVALHLLRFCHWCEDILGERMELRYFRDVQGREVDFVLVKNRQPWIAIEVKSSEESLDPSLVYLLQRQKFKCAYQLHLKGDKDYRLPKVNQTPIRVMPIASFLSNLP